MSYGVDAPQGLVPAQTLSGAPWTASVRTFLIDPTVSTGSGTIGLNDAVIPLGGATPTGYITVYATGNHTVIGVFQGCQYVVSNFNSPNGNLINSPQWTAATAILSGTQATAYVIVDPHVLYDIQANTTSNTTGIPLASGLFFNADIVPGNPNGLGTSTASLGAPAVTATLGTKIWGLTPATDITVPGGNAWGIKANNVLVQLNTPFATPTVAQTLR
jgi:hypothetical protein